MSDNGDIMTLRRFVIENHHSEFLEIYNQLVNGIITEEAASSKIMDIAHESGTIYRYYKLYHLKASRRVDKMVMEYKITPKEASKILARLGNEPVDLNSSSDVNMTRGGK